MNARGMLSARRRIEPPARGAMVTFSIQSGSNGNCIYVEAGDVRLLFDAGVSGTVAEERMAVHGRDPRDCDAVVVSHDHSDHSRCAGVFARKFGLPVYMTSGAHRAVRSEIGSVRSMRFFNPGDVLRFRDVAVHTIRTPHDGVETVCFLVEHDGRRLGIFTDLGHPFAALRDALSQVHAAYLESNFDRDMLRTGPYPRRLQRRIAAGGGHLSNDDSAELTQRCGGLWLRWVALAHLSHENNRPDLALDAHRRRIGAMFPLTVASRHHVSELLEV